MAKSKTQSYAVTSTLQHDGTEYPVGSTIELDPKSDIVAALKRLNVIADPSETAKAGTGKAGDESAGDENGGGAGAEPPADTASLI